MTMKTMERPAKRRASARELDQVLLRGIIGGILDGRSPKRIKAIGPVGPCGPCAPGLTPFGGPASGLWPGGGGIGGETPLTPGGASPVVPVVAPVGPPAVDLGSAGAFRILSMSGISNVPTSSVVGDIGVSPIDSTAITGFALVLDGSGQFATSSQVVGLVYAADYAPPTPAMLTAAVLDMQAAYTDAAGRPADSTNLAGGLLAGQVLTGGVYRWTTNVLVAGVLTLVGGPDDTFIFQIDGTLDLAPGAVIALTGGVNPANIVWQVAGAVTIGPGAIFNGTILGQTNIAVQTGATVHGRLYAQTAVTLDMNNVGP